MPAKIARYVLAAPRFLGWLFPLLAVACFFARDLRMIDDAVLAATWRPWLVAKGWRWSMTLAAGMVLHPDSGERVLAHERVHVRQAEDNAIGALVFALLVSLVELHPAWMLLWPSLMLIQTGAFLGAVLRGGDVYRDAEHERSAYAQTDLRPDGSSWLGQHESRPRS
jgi:hypothetical protein